MATDSLWISQHTGKVLPEKPCKRTIYQWFCDNIKTFAEKKLQDLLSCRDVDIPKINENPKSKKCENLLRCYHSLFLRSAEFDESLNICRLSREDRRSQPGAFRRQPGSTIDYLENQCVRCKQ